MPCYFICYALKVTKLYKILTFAENPLLATMITHYGNISEEELKNCVARDWFPEFDTTRRLGEIDFSVYDTPRSEETLFAPSTCFLWGESKKGTRHDIYESFIQLILTIGKARTFDNNLPPEFLCAFDAKRIGFVPYSEIMHVFAMNDFNWNVTPSNHETKEFKLLLKLLKEDLKKFVNIFEYNYDGKELRKFIKLNFKMGKKGVHTIQVNKNNFTFIYNRWVRYVKPSINLDWEIAKIHGVLDCDFFLADLISRDGKSIKDNLNVVLAGDHYETDRRIGAIGLTSTQVEFLDFQEAYNLFWNSYTRPPKKEYWDYIIKRRDLLVPQDVRERKGSYFTPRIWVEKSQEYLADSLGEDWQDEYYIWDCCCGTGNLEFGLTNKYRVWLSTIDKSDVDVIIDSIRCDKFNMLESHVFQFDFLNGDFSSLPESLRDVIEDEEKRKKLIIYINPPYAETATDKTSDKERINKRGVSFTNIQRRYGDTIGIATKELFAQFLIRAKMEIPGCVIANFSTIKHIQGPNFIRFRNVFGCQFLSGFIVPADTFDNVKGHFPIGFMIWKTSMPEVIESVRCDIYDHKGNFHGFKNVVAYEEGRFITDWFRPYHTRIESTDNIGAIGLYGSDFQHSKFIYVTNVEEHTNRWTYITKDNLIEACIYNAVRHCISRTWINDRDQFLYPSEAWAKDIQFQFDCLIWTLFDNNNIKYVGKPNHWIPYREEDVNAKDSFKSHFMYDFLSGKVKRAKISVANPTLFDEMESEQLAEVVPLASLSKEAQDVYECGKEIWRYYMSQKDAQCNASYYDIRAYFQGFSENKRGQLTMNSDSKDYNYLILKRTLTEALKALAVRISKKAYDHGFLLG